MISKLACSICMTQAIKLIHALIVGQECVLCDWWQPIFYFSSSFAAKSRKWPRQRASPIMSKQMESSSKLNQVNVNMRPFQFHAFSKGTLKKFHIIFRYSTINRPPRLTETTPKVENKNGSLVLVYVSLHIKTVNKIKIESYKSVQLAAMPRVIRSVGERRRNIAGTLDSNYLMQWLFFRTLSLIIHSLIGTVIKICINLWREKKIKAEWERESKERNRKKKNGQSNANQEKCKAVSQSATHTPHHWQNRQTHICG